MRQFPFRVLYFCFFSWEWVFWNITFLIVKRPMILMLSVSKNAHSSDWYKRNFFCVESIIIYNPEPQKKIWFAWVINLFAYSFIVKSQFNYSRICIIINCYRIPSIQIVAYLAEVYTLFNFSFIENHIHSRWYLIKFADKIKLGSRFNIF